MIHIQEWQYLNFFACFSIGFIARNFYCFIFVIRIVTQQERGSSYCSVMWRKGNQTLYIFFKSDNTKVLLYC